MQMTCTDLADDVVQVVLVGRLDTPGVDRTELRLTATIVPRGLNALIDLSGVEFAGSMAIRMFITLARALANKGRKLVLYAPQPMVDQVFETASLRELIPIVADMDAALRTAHG